MEGFTISCHELIIMNKFDNSGDRVINELRTHSVLSFVNRLMSFSPLRKGWSRGRDECLAVSIVAAQSTEAADREPETGMAAA